MTERELLDTIRELATEWATQPNDYDEDTEQQIDDGRVLLGLLEGSTESSPPLGYVVLRGDFEHEDIELVDQRVWPDLEIAGDVADRASGTTYELRGVKP
ncbi:hypothetical protein [Nocardia sp. NPDC049149]|uniref:hypothetical protein n=1 Tax=Nocardia sp. NPDC049149 TaxID=3364315 RepID=UPI00371EC114